MPYIVAIDGPAGSGKGTITKLVAEKLGLINVDTGAIYRCVSLEILKKGIKLEQEEKILELIDNIDMQVKYDGNLQLTFLDGEDVTKKIRSKEVTQMVSLVSIPKEIRIKVTEIIRKISQKSLSQEKSIIMEGRDITTVIFPDAQVKIYLDASSEERAKRRCKQNEEIGINTSYEEVIETINKRDKTDMTREYGALKRVDDAIYIDSSNMKIEEVVDRIIEVIKEKI